MADSDQGRRKGDTSGAHPKGRTARTRFVTRIPIDLRAMSPWWEAIHAAHDDGDLTPLIELLRSDIEMVPAARQMLAALLERRGLVKKRGGQMTPLFKMSAETRLALAAEMVRGLQAGTDALFGERLRKMSRADAIKKTAQLHGLNVETLANYMDGKRGASRRHKQRRTAASGPRRAASGHR